MAISEDVADVQVPYYDIAIQYNEGKAPFHIDLNLAGAHSIKVKMNPDQARHIRGTRTANNVLRAIRAMTRSQQRQYNTDELPDVLIGENMDKEDDPDPFAMKTTTDQVTHPQYHDITVQKALTHRRIEFHQQDDYKIMRIIQAARKADAKTPLKQLVTKSGRYSAANGRTS